MKIILWIIVIVIVIFGAWGLFGQSPENGNTKESAVDAVSESSVVNVAVLGKDFSFTPAEIKVKKGDTVKITFTSESCFHDWTIDEFSAQTERVNTGGTTSVEFIADRIGTFEYYCSVGSHRQMGMVGNLIVE